uniref:Uncharacterized protein n=1 Tax=Sphaerodactylus townsendi TaxID=933632 RepID=A0ACB8E6M1_9SAUR
MASRGQAQCSSVLQQAMAQKIPKSFWINTCGSPLSGLRPTVGGSGQLQEDEQLDTLAPDLHGPSQGLGHSIQREAGTESPYQLTPLLHNYRGARPKGRRESTWLPYQDISPEWDLKAQKWSKAQAQAGAWAPKQGADAWRQEQDEMQQDLYFLRRNIEFLLALTETGGGDRWPLGLVPLREPPPVQSLQDQGPPRPAPPANVPPGGQRVEAHMEKYGEEYEEEVEQVHKQFEDHFQEEKVHTRLQKIRQGTQSVAKYISEFRQLARVIQLAQWALVTGELTTLEEWYIRAGEVEIQLHKVQQLKQRSSPSCKPLPPPPLRGPMKLPLPSCSDRGVEETHYTCHRRLGLRLHCGGEGHMATVSPGKKDGTGSPPVK